MMLTAPNETPPPVPPSAAKADSAKSRRMPVAINAARPPILPIHFLLSS
jgi:hypothetical protein